MSAVMTDWITRHRFTVDEYYKMDEVGILAPDARVELIEGQIIDLNGESCSGAVRADMTDWVNRHRFTVDEYHRMAEVGILAPNARVELIEGEIIDMSPIGTNHGGSVAQLSELLFEAVGKRAQVFSQSSIRLSDLSELVPDFVLTKRRADFYRRKHPGPADILLVIEVSDSTLRHDLQVKAPLYARHGIPEYWIVDLPGQQIRFLRSPDSGQYTDTTSTGTPGVVSPVALPEVRIDLAHVLDD